MRWPLFERRRRPSRGIIIGGCARSGTTLLLSILSSHKEICAIPYETQVLCPTAYGPDFRSKTPLSLSSIDSHLERHLQGRRYRYWCEKTPKNVWFFKRILTELTKRVKIIHIVRDGRDVIVSRHPQKPNDFWVSAERWIQDVTYGHEIAGHPRVLTIRYEDLVSHFEETVNTLFKFLGLEVSVEVLDFPNHATVRKNDAWPDGVGPIHQRSIGKWKSPEFVGRVEGFLQRERAVTLLRHYHYLS
ncbi:MAG: sulfotransferase [Pirellulaceae bacterium]|nr:sulfotransferase [Pirellulaceae bacterium]